MIGHPGKKLLFMGQEFAQEREWSEARELDWYLLKEEQNQKLQHYFSTLLKLYKSDAALYSMDSSWEGFEWINADDASRSIYSFMRHSKDGKSNLVFVINFTPMERTDYMVGVPQAGTYKLVLDSNEEQYGGNGQVRPTSYKAVEGECDGQPYRLAYSLPPYGVAVFRYAKKAPAVKKAPAEKKAPAKKPAAKKTTKKAAEK